MNIKRKFKNSIRNIMLNDLFKDTAFVRSLMRKRQNRIEDNRRIIFQKYSLEAMEEINKILSKGNIEFWLDYGTLLGAIRDNDFIAHDLDLDFGMFYNEDEVKKIEHIFEESNIKKHREFLLEGKIVEQTYSYKGLCFDIFYYFTDEKEMWTYGFTYRKNKLKKVSQGNKDISEGFDGMRYFTRKRGLETYKFKGMNCLVPENPHEYLRCNYGENYMTPIKEWDYVEAPSNKEQLNNNDIKMIEYF
ncbi:LicD family protein [Clostridium massiliamazoniense]|uniref:LicD family protein n=1 Tax=Clostridium massiliamazoniense TaxID=1347366 RepID=UPI0006D7A557|nr:LicD family protein [Clostridium massiliamazoniense]